LQDHTSVIDLVHYFLIVGELMGGSISILRVRGNRFCIRTERYVFAGTFVSDVARQIPKTFIRYGAYPSQRTAAAVILRTRLHSPIGSDPPWPNILSSDEYDEDLPVIILLASPSTSRFIDLPVLAT